MLTASELRRQRAAAQAEDTAAWAQIKAAAEREYDARLRVQAILCADLPPPRLRVPETFADPATLPECMLTPSELAARDTAVRLAEIKARNAKYSKLPTRWLGCSAERRAPVVRRFG